MSLVMVMTFFTILCSGNCVLRKRNAFRCITFIRSWYDSYRGRNIDCRFV